MRPDKFKRRFQSSRADDRLRRQIATEAARRLIANVGGEAAPSEASAAEYYAAKRKAAAVLGHTVRPGDLPSDTEVREQISAVREQSGEPIDDLDDDESEPSRIGALAQHLDRFTIYRMRLAPLEAVKQDARYHPEGDALYHSLQVFELARAVRPYDEEFQLAALLHDVGKAIDPRDHVAAALAALEGTLTPRTAWLIAHHMDLLDRQGRALGLAERQALERSEYYEDLVLLRELDNAGRAIGVEVGTVEAALASLQGLEAECDLGNGGVP